MADVYQTQSSTDIKQLSLSNYYQHRGALEPGTVVVQGSIKVCTGFSMLNPLKPKARSINAS